MAVFRLAQVIGQKYWAKKTNRTKQNKNPGYVHIGNIVSIFGPLQYKKDVDKIA